MVKKKADRCFNSDKEKDIEIEESNRNKSGPLDAKSESPKKHLTHDNAEKKEGISQETVTYDLSSLDPKSLHKRKQLKIHKQNAGNAGGRRNDKKRDPFPGDAPVSKKKIAKYKRGRKVESDTIKTGYHRAKYVQSEKKFEMAARQAARSELLLPDSTGRLEADEGEETTDISQHQIANAVDITSAQKYFELNLPHFGPYRMNYTRNGRHLLIGGRKGHVAALDWQTKKLMCEMNAMETVQDVQWLHIETMFAVAQKRWTYIYDNQGIELHCLKMLDQVLRLDFLPYHFMLVASNARGYLSYIDVSVGQKVAGYTTGLGRLDVLCHNPRNAIVHMGHTGGTVSLWSPNIKEPLVKMLCHGGGTRSIAVDNTGYYMATSGLDRKLKLWDLRMYRTLHAYRVAAGANDMSFSQRGMLAAGMGNIVEVYPDPRHQTINTPYLCHRLRSAVNSLEFCPYEDVLGVGNSNGFASLLVPGSGEPNFDALEANPYQTKKQRQQAEVKMLLEKIQPDMIHLDTNLLSKIDTKTLQDKMDEKHKLLYLKPEAIEFEPKYKKKGRNKTGRLERRKKGVKFERKRDQFKEQVKEKQKELREEKKEQNRSAYNVLGRFKTKTA